MKNVAIGTAGLAAVSSLSCSTNQTGEVISENNQIDRSREPGTISCMRGYIKPSDLGSTLMHEHVAVLTPGIRENWPHYFNEEEFLKIADNKLNELYSRGIQSIVEVTPPDWESAKKLKNILDFYIFRGQGNSGWDLSTSLERALKPFKIPPEEMWDLEKKILTTFKSRAHHYIQSPPKDQSYIEWLALIQHYGGVTRLLDFTESFYLAWYFALDPNAVMSVESILKKQNSLIPIANLPVMTAISTSWSPIFIE